MDNKDLKQENLFKQFLTSEVKFVLGIVFFVFGIAAPYYNITKDIALIQQSISNINTNHETHIQDILEQIKDIKSQQLELQKQILLIK